MARTKVKRLETWGPLVPVRGSPVYAQVRDRVQQLVTQGSLKPGDQLPSERTLAEQLRISRHSLRQALSALEERGLLEIRHGSGAYLRSEGKEGVVKDLTEALVTGNRELPHIVEARYAIERFLVAFAARRRSALDLLRLEQSLTDMQKEINSGGNGVEADREFHDRIAIAAKSPVLRASLLHLRSDIDRMREETLAQPASPEGALRGHKKIFEAIKASDPAAAAMAMEQHILEAADTLLASDFGQGSLSLLAYDMQSWPRTEVRRKHGS